jgi:hypothetical protein
MTWEYHYQFWRRVTEPPAPTPEPPPAPAPVPEPMRKDEATIMARIVQAITPGAQRAHRPQHQKSE